MNILVHICCAPCAIYPAELMKRHGHRFAGFFYNPNIQPYAEYSKRREHVEKYSEDAGFDVIYGSYDIESYLRSIADNESVERRCPACWRLRIAGTARHAAENGFEAFTTTLLGSPYQDHVTIKGLCEDIARSQGVKFFYEDFRTGFREAHITARSKGIYCQGYCGCLLSEREKSEKRRCKWP